MFQKQTQFTISHISDYYCMFLESTYSLLDRKQHTGLCLSVPEMYHSKTIHDCPFQLYMCLFGFVRLKNTYIYCLLCTIYYVNWNIIAHEALFTSGRLPKIFCSLNIVRKLWIKSKEKWYKDKHKILSQTLNNGNTKHKSQKRNKLLVYMISCITFHFLICLFYSEK